MKFLIFCAVVFAIWFFAKDGCEAPQGGKGFSGTNFTLVEEITGANVSAYSPRIRETDSTPRISSSAAPVFEGMAASVIRSLIPPLDAKGRPEWKGWTPRQVVIPSVDALVASGRWTVAEARATGNAEFEKKSPHLVMRLFEVRDYMKDRDTVDGRVVPIYDRFDIFRESTAEAYRVGRTREVVLWVVDASSLRYQPPRK